MSEMRATHRPIEMVRAGMTVVDANGQEIGKVEYVELGDPEAVTVPDDSLPDVLEDAVAWANDEQGEPQVPEPVRTQLRREGFVKVDGPGLLDTDRYVRARWIAGVGGDRVSLSVGRERLLKEH